MFLISRDTEVAERTVSRSGSTVHTVREVCIRELGLRKGCSQGRVKRSSQMDKSLCSGIRHTVLKP